MAKWSGIYKEFGSNGRVMPEHCSSKELVRQLIEEARFTKPAAPRKKVGGKYPHLQGMR